MSVSIWSVIANAADYVTKVALAAYNGVSLIGYYEYLGEAYFRTLLAKLRDRWASVKGYGAVGDGITDDSVAIQRAIDANYGKMLSFSPGNYKVTISPKILDQIILDFSAGRAKLLLATQNMNGLELGDGTFGARAKLYGTKVYHPSFNPFAGVAQFTSGACILRNYVAFVDVINPQIYGLDGGIRKLWTAIRDIRAEECDTPYLLAQEMHGPVIYGEGTSGLANRTVDCNYDNLRIFGTDDSAIYWGENTAGLGLFRPTGYGITKWAIHINAVPGPSGQNYFVTDPDFECGNAVDGGGYYVQGGSRLILKGGWCGPKVAGGVLGILARLGALSDSCDINTTCNNGRILMEGGASIISGGEYTGDVVTPGTGILISGNDNEVADGVIVRQFAGTGIGYSGTPTGMKIGAVKFKNNGTDIQAITGFAALVGPLISTDISTDKSRSITAASSITIPIGVNVVELVGAGTVNTINRHGVGALVMIQASASGNTLGNAGNISHASLPIAIPAFGMVLIGCEGVNWYVVGQNF